MYLYLYYINKINIICIYTSIISTGLILSKGSNLVQAANKSFNSGDHISSSSNGGNPSVEILNNA
jgi:hypothetical protein